MFRFTTLVILVTTGSFALAQNDLIFTEVYAHTEHLRPVKSFALQDARSGAELWLIDAYAPRPSLEMVGPQLRYKRTGLALSIGFYTRFNEKEAQRIGCSGVFAIGKPAEWQLAGQYYAFEVPEGSRIGGPVPNGRVTFPWGKESRFGFGFGVTSIQGQAASAALGSYFSWRNKQWFAQARIGQQVSPASLAGRAQLFFRIDYRF